MNIETDLITPVENRFTRLTTLPATSATGAEYALSDNHFWREFIAGTKLLKRHAGRNNANLDNVIRANLKLLHQNFKTVQIYEQRLRDLPCQAPGEWHALATTEGIHCGLVNINTGHTTSVNAIVAQMHLDLPGQEDNQRPKGLLVLFVIRGKVQIKFPLTSAAYTPNNPAVRSVDRKVKAGNISICRMDVMSDHILSAIDSCQLLSLTIPHRTL